MKNDDTIGAAEKRARAERMRKLGGFEVNDIAERKASPVIGMAVVFAVAAVLALLLTDGALPRLSNIHPFGISDIDGLLFGKDARTFSSNADINRVLSVFLRAGAFFALTAIVPLLSYLVVRLFDRRGLSPFLVCWGVLLALLIAYGIF